MKNILLLFVFFATLAASPEAKAATDSSETSHSLSQLIARNMSFPENLKESVAGSRVKVSFLVDETGHIQVQYVDSDNSELRNYIIARMGRIRVLDTEIKQGQLYLINLKFSIL